MTFTVGKVLLLVSVIIFVLAAFGVTVFDMSEVEEIAAGLAFGSASALVA